MAYFYTDIFIEKSNKIEEEQVILPSKNQIWEIEGIPGYIRAYIQEIKDFKGDFIDVFKEARTLAKPVGNYAN